MIKVTKTILGTAVLCSVFFGLPSFALALTQAPTDSIAVPDQTYQSIFQRLQNKINELEAMIASLKAKLASLRTTKAVPVVSSILPGQKDDAALGPIFELQLELKEAGYADFAPTGYYGPKTQKAVEKLQIEKKILPSKDGTVNFQTRDELDKLMREKENKAAVPRTSPALLCKGDMNQDGAINFQDINIYRDVWNQYWMPSVQPIDREVPALFWFADINDDGTLTTQDINLFVRLLTGTDTSPICK